MLGISVVGRSNFDNVSTNQIDALQATEQGAKLARRPTAGFGGTSGGRNCIIYVSLMLSLGKWIYVQAGSKVSISIER